MKVRDKARDHLTMILHMFGSPMNMYKAGDHLRSYGWHVYDNTIENTARDLGFPVIGEMIYGLHE